MLVTRFGLCLEFLSALSGVMVIRRVFAANIRLPCDQHCSFACSKPQYTNLLEFELEGASDPNSNSNKFMYWGLEHANEQYWSHGIPMLAANTLLVTIITTESAQTLQTQPKTQTKLSLLGEKNEKQNDR